MIDTDKRNLQIAIKSLQKDLLFIESDMGKAKELGMTKTFKHLKGQHNDTKIHFENLQGQYMDKYGKKL